MEKINKRYLAFGSAALLLGGIALVSTNAFASDGSTSSSTTVAPSVNIPTVVSGSTDAPEVGDSVDSPEVTSSTDAPQVGDTVDSPEVTSSTDAPQVGDTVDSSGTATSTDTPEAGDTVDSGN